MSSFLTDPVFLLQNFLRCPSITPQEAGVLDKLSTYARDLGFSVKRPIFSENNTADVENFYGKLGTGSPHLMFAGHVDVVPPGAENEWRHPPFGATIEDGRLYGRGAVDMKGAIACFLAAIARYKQKTTLKGSISLLITGDEEGPALNGSVKLLEWAAKEGETWEAALVGEPTNPKKLGEMVKIGRRGTLSGMIEIHGCQGHVAYPERTANPIPLALDIAKSLIGTPLDTGTDDFQPSNLEITSIDTGNPTTNITPAKVSIAFNIRYNTLWDAQSMKKEIEARLIPFSHTTTSPFYRLTWKPSLGGAFLTQNTPVLDTLTGAIEKITGHKPQLSTTGGTSDARFIKDYCPVVEFGLVGQTMHQVDEYVTLDDLETLTKIYEAFLLAFFKIT